ncbi:PAS domain S-box-containing protein [Phyllobacterium sp. 1468]|uniref:HWE histidine kinase domain-containing protein n=1 Tax=Phyllobacterium sp. 1468 TaxID=2817759 RepID=UPI00285794B9|nr:HWE histidine kinase domain-containing protein [Phyllobacterium sp. 1468]MDR6631578.1 PAS domain S-box-containing protein [Phyllobacterium sp. 1468]
MRSENISESTLEFLSGSSRRDVLSSLKTLEIREHDNEFHCLAKLALSMSNSDGAQITLVDEKRSRVLSHAGHLGIVNIWAIEASSLASPDKSCLIILNAAEDVRYSEIDAVTHSPNIRFVAVAPICVSNECIGALSVLSDEPRTEFTLAQQEQLMLLARLAGSFISLKRESRAETDAMAKLHQDEDRNSMALEVGNVGSWVWDLRTGKFSGNRMAYSMLGLSPDQPVSGEDVFRAMHPDDFPGMKSAFTRALVSNQDYVGEFRAASSGQWLLGRGRIFERDVQGRPVVAVGVNIDITDTKKAAEKTRLLLRELNHRVKNTLAMLQSLARQTLNRTSDPAEFMEAFSGRLRAISEAHTLLSDREWSGISLIDLIAKQVEPYAGFDPRQIELAGEDMVLPPDHALGLGIALHELATNAARHGSLSVAGGRVRVSWHIEPGLDESRVTIHWVESNGPKVQPPEARGLGERLIERSLDKVLSSSVRLSYPETGMEALISMPIRDRSNILAHR